jgi:carbohydrate-selective porin OprB
MTNYLRRTTGLCRLGVILLVGLNVTLVMAEPSSTDPNGTEFDSPIGHAPGSITAQFEEDEERKETLFRTLWVERTLEPWYDYKTKLSEEHGLNFGVSFTHLYQWASDTIGPEDDASGFELMVDGTWTVAGRDTDSPTMIGFQFSFLDTLGAELPPAALFGSIGSLYPTAAAFGETDPSVSQLWLQKIYENRFGFRIGKMFPITAYDFFPLKNFRTDFVDAMNVADLVIPLPSYGFGGFVMYRPQPNSYLRFGLHDANADVEKSVVDTYDGELFKIFEFGFDPGIMERQPGRPPFGDVHISVWHQDERDDANVADGWGFVTSGSQRFGRFLPFLRYGYSDAGSDGPTPMKHSINGGVAMDNVFGQENDRIGVGLTWSDPSDSSLDDQGAIDAYYRIQLTEEIAISPTLQFIIDPVRNPNEDEIFVLGIRTRIEL